MINLLKDFVSGDRTIRLYINDGADEIRRRELEEIFSGKKGGQSTVLDSLVFRYLPTETAVISTDGRDDPTITFGSVGSVKMERVWDQEGRAASIRNTPILGLVNISRTDSGHSDGTHFANSEIRAWDSWGVSSFSLL